MMLNRDNKVIIKVGNTYNYNFFFVVINESELKEDENLQKRKTRQRTEFKYVF